MGLQVIFGIAIVAFLIVYLATKLERMHFFYRIILLTFFIFMISLVSKAAWDEKDNCIEFIINSTRSGNATHFTEVYNYDYVCTDTDKETADAFMKYTLYFYWISISYFFLFIIFSLLIWMGKIPNKILKKLGFKVEENKENEPF